MKRYVITLSAYIYAENDEQACLLSNRYAEHLDRMPNSEDNRAAVIGLCEQPFGKLGNRIIERL